VLLKIVLQLYEELALMKNC